MKVCQNLMIGNMEKVDRLKSKLPNQKGQSLLTIMNFNSSYSDHAYRRRVNIIVQNFEIYTNFITEKV